VPSQFVRATTIASLVQAFLSRNTAPASNFSQIALSAEMLLKLAKACSARRFQREYPA
jgi:hypothetical protein